MAIYDQLTPLDVLDLLGYGSLNGQARLEALECAAKIRLPSILFDYISAMEENPLLRTSGVILPGERFSFFYDDVSACFERARERRREGIDDEYDYHDYEVFRDLPRSRWPEVKEDYLRIGSDGFYDFGIPVECLGEENPMVFYQLPDCLWFWVDDRRLSTFLRDDFIRILLDDPDNPMAYYEYMLYYDADEKPPLTLDEILAKTGWRRQLLHFRPSFQPGRMGWRPGSRKGAFRSRVLGIGWIPAKWSLPAGRFSPGMKTPERSMPFSTTETIPAMWRS